MEDKEMTAGPEDNLVYRLRIDETQPSDAGIWRCELSNKAGKASAACSVKIIDNVDSSEKPPVFRTFLKNVTAREESLAIFQCKVTGNPTPTVKWIRNDVEVVADKYHVISDERGLLTLEVKEVGEDDVGIYKVEATNALGRAYCDARLHVRRLPECLRRKKLEYNLTEFVTKRIEGKEEVISDADLLVSGLCDNETIKKFLIKWKDDQTLGFPIHLTSKCAVEGCPVIFNCLVKGIPPFKVRWFKDNGEIFDGGRYFIKNRGGMLTLEIPCVRSEDTGNYMCEVRTTQGKIYTSCYLQAEPVLEIPKEEFRKPEFTKPMKRQTVDKGEIISFRVTAKGNPPPGFKWFKDGLELHDNHRISTEVMTYGVAQLTIEQADASDIGLYTCEAHNLAGRARSMVRLSVREEYVPMEFPDTKSSPEDRVNKLTMKGNSETLNIDPPEYTPQQFSEVVRKQAVFTMQMPTRQTIRQRGRLLLECCINGYPLPKVTWLKDGNILEAGDRVAFLQVADWHGVEIVDTVDSDAGQYVVRADQGEDTEGSVESSCQVEMTVPTETAQDLKTALEVTVPIIRNDQVVQQTVTSMGDFWFPGITPSFHLCNTEPLHSESVEEVELKDMCETPHFTQPLPDQLLPLDTDKTVSMECHVGGFPCPLVAWFKDEEPLVASGKVAIDWDKDNRVTRVQLKQLTNADTGRYMCVAYSNGGHSSTSTVLHIRHKTEEGGTGTEDGQQMENLPQFKIKLSDKEVPPGAAVKLECVAEGTPPPKVTWYKNDEPIEATIDKYTITSSVEGFHSLQIAGVHLSDADCYKCEAANEYGSVTTSAHLVVHEITDVHEDELTRPTFVEPLHSVIVMAGHDAILKCTAKGNPPPKFKWQRDVMQMCKSEKVKVSVKDGETTLTITDASVEDSGLYYCIAQNKLGQIKSCATLKTLGADKAGGTDPGHEEMPADNQNCNGSVDNSAESKRVTLYEDEGFDIFEKSGSSASDKSKENPSKDDTTDITPVDAKNPGDRDKKESAKQGAVYETDKTKTSVETKEEKKNNEGQGEVSKSEADNKTELAANENGCSNENNATVASSAPHNPEPSDSQVVEESTIAVTGSETEVTNPPRFICKPWSQWVLNKDSLEICVTVEPCPGLEVVWYKDGTLVSDRRCKMLKT